MKTHSSDRLTRGLVILIAGILVVRTAVFYGNAWGVYRDVAAAGHASFFKPGLIAAVEWTKDRRIPVVYALNHLGRQLVDRGFQYPPRMLEERDLYERLSEMLYPTEVRVFSEGNARPGDLILVATNAAPIRSTTVVFEQGQMRILRVNP